MPRLAGKVALVTGSAQGIGNGIARALASEGAVTALWDVKDAVHKAAEEIKGSGGKAVSHNVDVTDSGQIGETVQQILDEFGRIDILVNNAAIAHFAPFVDMTDSIRDDVMQVNFYGMWNCTKAILPAMIEHAYGRIINISSVTGPRVHTRIDRIFSLKRRHFSLYEDSGLGNSRAWNHG